MTLQSISYEKGDYLLIRNDAVIAVSGNEDFDDGDHLYPSIEIKEGDVIVIVVAVEKG